MSTSATRKNCGKNKRHTLTLNFGLFDSRAYTKDASKDAGIVQGVKMPNSKSSCLSVAMELSLPTINNQHIIWCLQSIQEATIYGSVVLMHSVSRFRAFWDVAATFGSLNLVSDVCLERLNTSPADF